MATADEYAEWIVKNQDRKGTPEFEIVAAAYKEAKAESGQQPEQTSMESRLAESARTGIPYIGMMDDIKRQQENAEASKPKFVPTPANLTKRFLIDPARKITNVATEVPIALGTGFGSMLIGNLQGAGAGLYARATGENDALSRSVENQVREETTNKLSYQPRSQDAQYVLGVMGDLFDASKIPPMPGMSGLPNITNSLKTQTLPYIKAAQGVRQADNAANLAQTSRNNLAKIEAANLAKKHNILLNPHESNPTIKGKIVGAIIGDNPTDITLANRNEIQFTNMAKKAMGIAPEKPLSMSSLKKGRKIKGDVYNDISKLPKMPADEILISDIKNIGDFSSNTPDVANFLKMQMPKTLGKAKAAIENGFNGNDANIMTRTLRKQANLIYKADNPSPKEIALAESYMRISNAIDDALERNLEKMNAETPGAGYGNILSRLREARPYIAQSHIIENATDFNLQRIDPIKIAKITARQPGKLTGVLADMGKIAGVFPDIAKVGAKRDWAGAKQIARSSVAGIGAGMLISPLGVPFGIAAAGGATAGELLGMFERKRLLKGKINTIPPDYRPLRERLGYNVKPEPIIDNSLYPGTVIPPEEVGLTLAPKGARLSPVPFIQPKQEFSTGLLSLADDSAPLSTKQPVVPFNTSENIIDFELRQDFFQRPEIVKAVNDFRMEAARLEGLIKSSSGFWRNRYKAELNALQQEFQNEMNLLGARNAAETHGANSRLYGVPRSYKMPIKKSGMLTGDNQ